MLSVTITLTDPTIADDQLVLEWATAMERKLERLLKESGKRIFEEARSKRDLGISSGDYHVLVAQHRGMK